VAPHSSSSDSPAATFDAFPAADRSLHALLVACLAGLHRLAHGRLPRWVRSIADTADIVHDVVVRSLRRAGSIERDSDRALAAYLAEAVRNRIRDEHRRLARRGIADPLSPDLRDQRPTPFDLAVHDQLEARYRAALDRLSPADRALIVAHVELDYTHDQLALMIGRSRNAARMALHRAIRRLAEAMRLD
jgi:RNA polymerase sigma factor (sigma-70 family)